MAAPNIMGLTTVTCKSSQLLLTTSNQDLVTNAASSGQAFKVTSLYVANIHATATATVTVTLNKAGSPLVLLNATEIPANFTLVVIDKESPINLEENDKIQVLSSAASSLNAFASYEVMS